jgi:cytochrome c nitrite reductase small subunit
MLPRYNAAVQARYAVAIGVVLGLLLGLGGYTFIYARGGSYLGSDPKACANCHVMREQFEGWQRSSHRSVAVCNDCHAPHNLLGKYATKAVNGFWHSFYFTTGTFHEPIRITPRNASVTEGTCRTCHADIVHAIDTVPRRGEALSCVSCHRNVGHLH